MPESFKQIYFKYIIYYLIAALAFVLLTFWLAFDINRRVMIIKEAKEDLSLRYKSAESLAELKQDEKEADQQKFLLETRLPTQDRLILSFRKDMTALAKTNNVEMEFAYGTEKVGDDIGPGILGFNMTTKSTFANWVKFLNLIETGRYYVSFKSFNLAGSEEELKTAINGEVFSQ